MPRKSLLPKIMAESSSVKEGSLDSGKPCASLFASIFSLITLEDNYMITSYTTSQTHRWILSVHKDGVCIPAELEVHHSVAWKIQADVQMSRF